MSAGLSAMEGSVEDAELLVGLAGEIIECPVEVDRWWAVVTPSAHPSVDPFEVISVR